MDKENVEYIHNGVLFCHSKSKIMSFVGKWMEQKINMLSKISQTQKNKYGVFSLKCRIWSKKRKTHGSRMDAIQEKEEDLQRGQ
jgi:hypothetical protein